MAMMMNKRGDFVWSNVASLILVLALLLVLLIAFFLLKDNIITIWQSISDFLRFGGG
jgi:hypothetical protein